MNKKCRFTITLLFCFCIVLLVHPLILQQHVVTIEKELKKPCCTTQAKDEAMPLVYSDFTIPEWITECTAFRSLDPLLIHAIIMKESNFNAKAVSKTNDLGLMQIHKPYWDYYFSMSKDFNEKYEIPNDPFNPYANIIAGCNAIAYWKERCAVYGDTSEVAYINCYNKGMNYFISLDTTYSDAVYDIYNKLEESEWPL